MGKNLQRCRLGGVRARPLADHSTKFTPRFYLLYHSSSNAAFLHVILDKDLHLVIFPKSFPLFSMLHGQLTFMKGKPVFSGNKQKSVPGTKF